MLRAHRGDDYKIEQALTFNIFSLVTMPLAMEMEKRRFARTQQEVAMEVLRLASETRKAYFTVVAAEETVRYMRQVKAAADAGAELARRMAQAGNWSKLQQAREQGFYADAALNLARAEQAQSVARERLTRLLGLWGAQIEYKLPERLPDLPEDRRRICPTSSNWRWRSGSTCRRRGLRDRGAGEEPGPDQGHPLHQRAGVRSGARTGRSNARTRYKKGYEISFEMPLFDWGGAQGGQGRGDLHAGGQPRRGDRDQRALRGARGLRGLPLDLRHRAATTATRSCRSASASRKRTCCATTAC